MGLSMKLGRIFGIDIKVHITFLIILVLGTISYSGGNGLFYGFIVTIALFTLVLLHELGHSLAAMRYNIPVKDIVLLPIGGVARLERMPEKPSQELVVALAGPLVNVILAIALSPILLLSGVDQAFALSLGSTAPAQLLNFLFYANVMLAVFNMIPAFPMDGGRVLRAILGFFITYEKSTTVAVNVGRVFALLMAVGPFLLSSTGIIGFNPWLIIIAFFIFSAGGQELQAVKTRSLLRQMQASEIMTPHKVALSPYATIGQVAPMIINSGKHANFAILDPTDGQLLGVTSGRKVANAMAQGRWAVGITEIMQNAGNIPQVTSTAKLDEVQETLERTSNAVAAVYDGLIFRGLISREDIYRAFQFLANQGSVRQRMA